MNQNFDLAYIISESLKLAWRNKLLWMCAVVLVSGSFTGFNNISNFSDLGDYTEGLTGDKNEKLLNFYNDYNGQEYKNEAVLGESVVQNTQNNKIDLNVNSEAQLPVSGTVELTGENYLPGYLDIETRISDFMPHIILLSAATLILLAFSIAIAVFTTSWATGAIIGGANAAIQNKKYTFSDLGTYGRVSLKEVVKFRIFYFLLTLVFTVLLLLMIILMNLLPIPILPTLIVMLLIVGGFIVYVLFMFGELYGTRHIVLGGQKFYRGFVNGMRMFTQNLGTSVLLGVTNCVFLGVYMVAWIFVFALLLLPVGIIGISSTNNILTLVTILIFGVPLVFIFIGVSLAGSAYLKTYATIAWTMLYNFIVRGNTTNAPASVTSVHGGQNE